VAGFEMQLTELGRTRKDDRFGSFTVAELV